MKRIIILSILLIMFVSLFGCDYEAAAPVDTDTDLPEVTTAAPVAKVIENRFVLKSDIYDLNAVYTYIDDGQRHPTVLLIAGSGPQDCDETIGLLKPQADIAAGLAAGGINSLRFDKRTYKYGALFKKTDGIEEEYLIDCRNAIDYMKTQESCGDIWLLGHSEGGMIAPAIAAEDSSIKGLIIFNSSARNMAEIACDQFCAMDSSKSESYKQYRDAALSATTGNAKGYYYFGGTDYYWATLNQIDIIQDIKNAAVPTLIVNSKNDAQTFEVDIKLWQDTFSGSTVVELYVDETMSHFGYDIDATDQQSFLSSQVFPQRIIDLFVNFIIK